jgi:hypothetical protein
MNSIDKKIDYLIEEAQIQLEVNYLMNLYFKDNLLEEAGALKGLGGLGEKYKKLIEKIVRLFKNPDKLKKLEKAVEREQKKREQYLKKYNIDVKDLQRKLKAGEDVSIPMKMILEEMFSGLLEKGSKIKNWGVGAFISLLLVLILMVLRSIFPYSGILFGLLVSPLLEETMKRISVKYKAGGFTFLSFNVNEIGGYFEKLPPGLSIADLSLVGLARLITVGMHLITWMMHTKGNLLDKYREDFKIEDTNKNKYKNAASFQAILLHTLYNGVPELIDEINTLSLSTVAAVNAGGLAALEKEKLKKEFSKAVDKFVKPLKNQKIPQKIT